MSADAAVEEVFREDRGRLLALLAARLGDLDLAEEVASEAIEAALHRWPVDGVPDKPVAWLLTTARRRAVDRLRRDRAYADRLALLQVEADRRRPPPVDGRRRHARRAAPAVLHLLPPGAVAPRRTRRSPCASSPG